MTIARPEIGREIATTADGIDITRGYTGPLLLPFDSVLRNRGGYDLQIYEQVLSDPEVEVVGSSGGSGGPPAAQRPELARVSMAHARSSPRTQALRVARRRASKPRQQSKQPRQQAAQEPSHAGAWPRHQDSALSADSAARARVV